MGVIHKHFECLPLVYRSHAPQDGLELRDQRYQFRHGQGEHMRYDKQRGEYIPRVKGPR